MIIRPACQTEMAIKELMARFWGMHMTAICPKENRLTDTSHKHNRGRL